MRVKLSPEVKQLLRAGGHSEAEINTLEVKMAQNRNRKPPETMPEGWTEEDMRRWDEKVDSGDLRPMNKD